MTLTTVEVKSYQVELKSAHVNTFAHIHCQCADGWTVHIQFIITDGTIPACSTQLRNKIAMIRARPEHFPYYLDLLRNEKPLYMRLSDDAPDTNTLTTSNEPVGDGELSAAASKTQI
jgi:hypothetical protein